MNRHSFRLLGCLSIVLLAQLASPLGTLPAQDTATSADGPLRYRMIFAPATQIEQMARGEYRPMRRDEFQQRVQVLQRRVPAELEQGVSLVQATYTARLEGRRLLVGSVAWEIELRRDELAWLSLGRSNLALADPRWLADDRNPGGRLEADLGADVRANCLLAVPRSGTLQARWTLAPSSTPGPTLDSADDARNVTDHDWVFNLRLLPCPVSRIDLQLPADLELTVDHGVARQIPLAPDPAAAESSASATPAVDFWQIDLGGRHTCQIRLRRRNAPRPQVRVRQVTRYGVSEQGLDVTADLALDCDEVELDRLELRAELPLRITKVVHESQVLSWSNSVASDDSRVATVEFPQPLRGLNRTVRISAVAPPDVVATWQLPRIRVAGVDWLQESARLQVHPPFVLQDLQLTHGLRLRTTEDMGPGPRTVAVQFFDPEHRVQLRLAPEARPATFKSATEVIVGPRELLATMEVDVRSRSADQFEIEATLEDDWNLESVEAAEPEVLDQWQVISSPASTRQLRLRFQRPLPIESWTRLTLRARRAFAPGPEPVQIRRLRPIEFAEQQPAPRQFLSIPPQSGVEVSYPHDGQITWLSPDDLDARETHLLGTPARERLILLDRSSLNETVVLNEAADHLGPVTAKLRTTAQLSRRQFKEMLRIELSRVPQPPRHFHVRLSQSRPGDVRWFLESAPQQELSAMRVPGQEGEDEGEQWRIAWPETSDESLVVIGERSWPTVEGGLIALARVEEARTQEGIVVIEGTADVDLAVQASPLFTPLPVEPTAFRQFNVSRYRFRYAPIADIFSPDNVLSIQTLIPAGAGSRLVVWREVLETHLDQSGVDRADVRLWIENLGADRLRVRLPSNSILRQTHVNTQEITTASDLQGRLEIPLPTGERFPLIRIQYDQPGRGLGWLRTLRHETPQLAAPVLHRQWNIWTPPEYALAINGSHPRHDASESMFAPRRRKDEHRPFNLFSLADWQRQFQQLTRPRSQLTGQLSQVLAALGEPSRRTVGDWLRSLDEPNVQVDAFHLAALGIQPSTPLPGTHAQDNVQRGIDRLQQLHLCLLELAGELVVSSENELAEIPDAVICHESASVAKLAGPAANAWENSAGESARITRVPASDWQATPVTWQAEPKERAPYIAAGWQRHGLSFPTAAGVVVYRTPMWRVVSSVGFLAALALSWWLARWRPRLALAIPIVCLAAALLTARPLNGLGWYALVGSLVGWCVPRFRMASAPLVQQRAGRPLRATRTAAPTSLLLALSTILASTVVAHAQTPLAVAPRPPLEVFVPADEQGRPQGEHLFVPLELQRRLMDRGLAGDESGPAWVLAQATYAGVLEPQADASQLQLSTITADFELYVARLGGAIQFPLAAEAVSALKREAFLDGRRIQLQWDANHSTLALPIQQAGRHHLQLSFQTLTSTDNGRAYVELPIPVTPSATLELTSPQDPQSIQVPSALGAIQRREATSQLRADLGPNNRLRIEWPTTASGRPAPAIDQLSWLRLERDEVRYDVQLVPDVSRVFDSSLVLEVDERLQLDVAVSDQPLSLAPSAERGVRRLEFDLVEAGGDAPVIQLSFVLTGTTGIGHVRLPRCRVLNQTVRHWLAVSADARLGLRVTPDNALTLPVDSFVTNWGGTQLPDFAYELPKVPNNWSCEGQWIETLPTIEVQEAHVVGREGTRLLLVATFRTDDREMFQQSLQVPEDLLIENIQRLPGAVGAPLRWSRYASDRVTIFFDDPPIGTFQIGVVGYRSDTTLETRRLPRIEFARAQLEQRQVDIFRDSEVVLPGLSAMTEIATPEMAPFLRGQIGLARWQSRLESPDESMWTVALQPNDRRLKARMNNIIAREQGAWVHRLQVDVELEQGVLDALTFELPESWTAGLQEDRQMRITYAQASQPGMVRVTFWPQQQPFDAVSPIHFSGLIPVSPGRPLTVPNIRLLDRGEVERHLFLPVRLEEQAILWSTTGLDPLDEVDVPPVLAQADALYQAYRVPDGPFQATRLPANSTVDKPTVSLVDLQIGWQHDGRFEGLALFDLQPDGLEECWIQFPPGIEPIAIYSDELPIRMPDHAPADADGILQPIELASNELPQRIRVLLSGRVSTGGSEGQSTIEVPRLYYRAAHEESPREIPVSQTLWTVYQLVPGLLQVSGEPMNSGELDLRRLSHLADILDHAALLATDFSSTDLEHWYSTWGRRFLVAQQRLQPMVATRSADEKLSQAIQQARQRHAAVVPQLKVDWVLKQLQAEGALSDSMSVWLDAMPGAVDVQHRTFPSGVAQLPIDFRASAATGWPWRLGLVLAAGFAGLALQRWPRFPREVAPRWPLLAGVLVGLAWWLWLEPSLLGWAIVGLSLLLIALLP